MTTEERPKRPEPELATSKRRKRLLIVLGVVLLGVAAILVTWCSQVSEGTIEGRHLQDMLVVSILIAAGVGIVCLTLGWILFPFRARLLSVGIVLLGVATATLAWLLAAGYDHTGWKPMPWHLPDKMPSAICGFVIAVTGLSGLVCAILGLRRLLANGRTT
ncbi:MAG: hypothetical protein ABSH10_04770 [Phycisphaerae bacterium]|jgi:hypothetical protein